MSDFMERNVSNFFKHLDIKKNGYISLKDFLELPEHLADAEEVVGADREQLIASFAELWRKYMKSAGSDDEGLLTASILVESIRQQKNDPVFKEAYLAVCRYVYFSLDINRDGFLQEDEYARAFSGVGLHDTEISRRVFEAIDLNKDGKLSFEEYASALYGNLVSEDENGPYALAKSLKVNSPLTTEGAVVPAPPSKPKQNGEAAGSSLQQTDEILNSILPPREWMDVGQLWVQQVSSTPATRLDVVSLQEELDRRLQQRQAKETGICPVRRELYSQCFDELIRQVTINCAERGLLLLRVRDEIRMTIAAYQTLYESSVAFGMRKALESEKGKADMERQIKDLITEKAELERQVNEQKARCEQIEKRGQEQRMVEEKKHLDEINFLKKTNQQLKAQLEGVIAPKK